MSSGKHAATAGDGRQALAACRSLSDPLAPGGQFTLWSWVRERLSAWSARSTAAERSGPISSYERWCRTLSPARSQPRFLAGGTRAVAAAARLRMPGVPSRSWPRVSPPRARTAWPLGDLGRRRASSPRHQPRRRARARIQVSCEEHAKGAPMGASLAPGSLPLTAPSPTTPMCRRTRSRR